LSSTFCTSSLNNNYSKPYSRIQFIEVPKTQIDIKHSRQKSQYQSIRHKRLLIDNRREHRQQVFEAELLNNPEQPIANNDIRDKVERIKREVSRELQVFVDLNEENKSSSSSSSSSQS
jgi:hypothetical protein